MAAFVREWKAERQRAQQTTGRGVFVPLAFQAGEAFQFDWSEDWAILGGERTKLQVAHCKLSHSRAFILRAYPGRYRRYSAGDAERAAAAGLADATPIATGARCGAYLMNM
jgi:hypothetical protein